MAVYVSSKVTNKSKLLLCFPYSPSFNDGNTWFFSVFGIVRSSSLWYMVFNDGDDVQTWAGQCAILTV